MEACLAGRGQPIANAMPRTDRTDVEAAGVEDTGQAAPARDRRHQALAVLIGNWINEGHTVGTGEIPSVPILTSEVRVGAGRVLRRPYGLREDRRSIRGWRRDHRR